MRPVLKPVKRRAEMSQDIIDQYLQLLPEGHIIYTLYSEHRIILNILDEMSANQKKVCTLNGPLEQPEVIMDLVDSVEKLVKMRVHHIRENETIFKELNDMGMHKYHHVLQSEHRFLKEYKQNFLIFLRNLGETDFDSFKNQMNFQANGIIGLLREHIFVENNHVFPTALEMIQSPETWAGLAKISDNLGYSLYTPGDKSSEISN